MKLSQSSTHSLILYYEKYTDTLWPFMTENLTGGSLDHPRYCSNQKAELLIHILTKTCSNYSSRMSALLLYVNISEKGNR